MPVIPALRTLRHENCEFKANLDYYSEFQVLLVLPWQDSVSNTNTQTTKSYFTNKWIIGSVVGSAKTGKNGARRENRNYFIPK